MRKLSTLVVVLMLSALVGSPGATAADGDCHDLFPEDENEDVIVCEDVKYLSNESGAPISNGTPAGLKDDAPTAGEPTRSINVVPGVAFVNNSDPRFQHTIAGTVTGTLDTALVDAYVYDPVASSSLDPQVTYRVRLTVDRVVVLNTYGQDAQSFETMHVADDLAIVSFIFTDLYDSLDSFGLDNDADTEHEILIEFSDVYYGDGNNVMYYDSTDMPSSVTFNPVAPNRFATTLRT